MIYSYIFSLTLIFQLVYSFNLCSEDLKPQKPIVLIVGTRPEAIKMIPLYEALKSIDIPVVLCSTGQHKELLDEMLNLFHVEKDYDLKIMKQGQDLFYITTQVLNETKKVFEEIQPSLVVVQGDTTSAMASSLSAFYLKIPIAHVEAGLRTHNIYAPFPEEMNRLLISKIATFHFAPTTYAKEKLLEEGIDESSIYVTGNTVVDALYLIQDKIIQHEISPTPSLVDLIDQLKSENKKILLLTTHRRENFGSGLTQIFQSLQKAISDYPNLAIIYPMHPNPNIKESFQKVFKNHPNEISLLPPLPYQDLVYLLTEVDGVLTDSGGIQEEAISLNKFTLILRNETDRPEGLKTEFARLVGDDPEKIESGISFLMHEKNKNMKEVSSPYGNGTASKQISQIIENFYKKSFKEL